MAGVAAGAFHLKQLKQTVWVKPSKIRRVERDLKLTDKVAEKVFEKTKLWLARRADQ